MLQKLHIQNFLIIEQMSIDFSAGLNIITGETGAGKSILMDALNLILGARADRGVLADKNNKCIIEGEFKPSNSEYLQILFEEMDLDFQEEIIIRREISAQGKSRAFVNDTPILLPQLKQIAILLVDLHQQFDTLELEDNTYQLMMLDAMAENRQDYKQYLKDYNNYLSISKELDELQKKQKLDQETAAYNKYLYEELEELNFKENELEQIEEEIKLATNIESIKTSLANCYQAIAENENPLEQQIKSLCQQLQSISKFHSNIESVNNRLQSLQIELSDIAEEINQLNNHMQYDAEKIEKLNARMEAGFGLQKKHQVRSTSELLNIMHALKIKLEGIEDADNLIESKRQQQVIVHDLCIEQAKSMSKKRKNVAGSFIKKANELLKQVGMPNASFNIEIKPTELCSEGIDSISFQFDANKTGKFEPVYKVASGGELSRLMLCLKYLIAKKLDLPTLIFDEIDSGISGEAAKQVGIILKQLAEGHQLIAITHQPQIAAKGDSHYFVYKHKEKNVIKTNIKQLSKEERIFSIAQMLHGDQPSDAALNIAKEMMQK